MIRYGIIKYSIHNSVNVGRVFQSLYSGRIRIGGMSYSRILQRHEYSLTNIRYLSNTTKYMQFLLDSNQTESTETVQVTPRTHSA